MVAVLRSTGGLLAAPLGAFTCTSVAATLSKFRVFDLLYGERSPLPASFFTLLFSCCAWALLLPNDSELAWTISFKEIGFDCC